jgi:DNA-binding PadR family transcriptional regulator
VTRTEILLAMHAKPPRSLFYTMQLGGATAPLSRMEADGLIRSQSRYSGRMRQRDWYLTDEQHSSLSFLFADSARALPDKRTEVGHD